VELPIAIAILAVGPALTGQPQRGVKVLPPTASLAAGAGSYYALIVGIDEYASLPPLATAVFDARSIETALRDGYGFQTKLLVNGEATRGAILLALNQYRNQLRESDNLLIYYAGHGQMDRDAQRAYWLPVDSDASPVNWISADDLATMLRALPARHVLVVSDSCYSGDMTRTRDPNITASPADHSAYLQKMLVSRSRTFIASGGDEPVTDEGSSGHSVFTGAVLRGLRALERTAFSADDLFVWYVREAVGGSSRQTPRFAPIPDSGHDFGDFVFVGKTAAAATEEPAGGSRPASGSADIVAQAEIAYWNGIDKGDAESLQLYLRIYPKGQFADLAERNLTRLAHTATAQLLSAKDPILLADFVNTTGDPVFDDALKQGLAARMEQAPYYNILAGDRIIETLLYMGRSPDQRITNVVGREICQRLGVKALIEGSIAALGSHFVVGLQVVNVQTGDVFARTQVEAEAKEQVLHALGEATTQLRGKLGESLASIRKYDAPIEQATTSSLEALKAFSLSREKILAGDNEGAIRYARRAVELDPNFASAYRALAAYYGNLGDERRTENARKAYELRNRVSERERLMIEELYYAMVARDTSRRIETLQTVTQSYPSYPVGWNQLGDAFSSSGDIEKAVAAYQEAVRLSPSSLFFDNVVALLMDLGRFSEVKDTCHQALAQNLNREDCHQDLFEIATLDRDSVEAKRQLEWAAGQPDPALPWSWQMAAATFQGRFAQGRDFTQRAVEVDLRQNQKNAAARILANMARDEAIAGQCRQAEADGRRALEIATTRAALIDQGWVLAFCNDSGETLSIADEIAKRFPNDKQLNDFYLPCIRALAKHTDNNTPPPPPAANDFDRAVHYCRGQAYLARHMGAAAAAEFQIILDYSAWDGNALSVVRPAASAGLARAAALTGDLSKSRKAYEDFFVLWKDADPDLPLLVEAGIEYKKLQAGK